MKKTVMIPTDYYSDARTFLLEKGYEIVDCPSTATSEERTEIMKNCDAVIARTEKYTEEMIDQAENLKIIARAGSGFDNIPIDYCTEKGIWSTYTPHSNFMSVAEHAFSLMLACSHQVVRMNNAAKTGSWLLRDKIRGNEITGKTLGIIGCGRIGRKLAEMASFGLNMKVVVYDAFLPPDQLPDFCVPAESMDALLEISDFVSIHIPPTPETYHLVNMEFCKKMKDTSYIINCSRGSLVNEQELYTALKENIIAGAAVDVMETEPTAESPLFELDNFIVTPHFAALNKETINRMGLHAAQCVDQALSGETPTWPLNKIK